MMAYASWEMLLIHCSQVGFASEITQEKENKSHTLYPGNTLYISEVSSSVDGCQLGKHLSPLPVCECQNRARVTHLWSLFSMAASEMIQTLGRAARVSVALNRLRIVCVHIYIYTQLSASAKGVAASDPCVPDTAELCLTVLYLPRQTSHDSNFSFSPSKCLKWMSLQKVYGQVYKSCETVCGSI